ncbi:glycerophosphoryl diester phosphodiesterase membrane domain-containing protein [Patescibacteria group bacterium]
MKLGTALGGSFKTYFKKPLLFSGVYVAAMLVLIIFNAILIPSGILLSIPMALFGGDLMAFVSLMGLVFLLYIAVSIIVGALSLGGMIKASSAVYGGQKITIMECLKFAFSRVWDYVILGLRVFWYSLAWVLILLMILVPLLGFAGGTANAQGTEIPAELAEFMDSYDAEGLAAMEAMDFSGFESGDFDFTPAFMSNPIVGLVFLVLFVFVIYRSLRAMFSFYVLFDDPKIGTKEALEKSLKITKGNIWRLIGYLIVFGLVIGIISGVVMGVILTPIARALAGSMEALVIWQLIFNFIVAAVLAPISVLFYYIVYKGWSKEHGH